MEQMHSIGVTDGVSPSAYRPPLCAASPSPGGGSRSVLLPPLGQLWPLCAAPRVCMPPQALPSWGGDPGLGSLCLRLPQPVWEVSRVLYCPDADTDLSGLRNGL